MSSEEFIELLEITLARMIDRYIDSRKYDALISKCKSAIDEYKTTDTSREKIARQNVIAIFGMQLQIVN